MFNIAVEVLFATHWNKLKRVMHRFREAPTFYLVAVWRNSSAWIVIKWTGCFSSLQSRLVVSDICIFSVALVSGYTRLYRAAFLREVVRWQCLFGRGSTSLPVLPFRTLGNWIEIDFPIFQHGEIHARFVFCNNAWYSYQCIFLGGRGCLVRVTPTLERNFAFFYLPAYSTEPSKV